MLELLFIRLIIELLEKKYDLLSVSEDELGAMLKVKTDTYLNSDSLEEIKKELIDKLVQKYGILESMELLLYLKRDAIKRKSTVQNSRLKYDLALFIVTIDGILTKLSDTLKPVIYTKLLTQLMNLSNGHFDEERFISTITERSIDLNFLLGLDNENMDQTFLFNPAYSEEQADEISIDENAVIRSFKNRNRIMDTAKLAIKNQFALTEVSKYCDQLIQILKAKSEENIKLYFIMNILKEIKSEIRKLYVRKRPANKDYGEQLVIKMV